MEISIVAPYTINSNDEIYLSSLKELVLYLRKYTTKVELILSCYRNSIDLIHKANMFTANIIGSRVVTSDCSNVKSIIVSGLNACNRREVLLLTEDFVFDSNYNYLGGYNRFVNEHKRFNCFWDVQNGTNQLLIGNTFNFRILGSLLTAKTYAEVFMQILNFCKNYGEICDFQGYYDDFNFCYSIRDKKRMKKFLNKCSFYYHLPIKC